MCFSYAESRVVEYDTCSKASSKPLARARNVASALRLYQCLRQKKDTVARRPSIGMNLPRPG